MPGSPWTNRKTKETRYLCCPCVSGISVSFKENAGLFGSGPQGVRGGDRSLQDCHFGLR